MAENPLVRINFDPPEKIAQLYGIGLATANLIVERRNQNGAFHGPDDLAKIKGIGADLAVTLAPSIDWSLPDPQGKSKERNWIGAISDLVILGVILRLLIIVLTRLFQKIETNDSWISILTTVLLFAILIVVGVGFIIAISIDLSRDKGKIIRYYRIGRRLLIIATSIFIFMGFVKAFYYQFFAPNKWKDVIHNNSDLVLILLMPYFLFVMVPVLLTLRYPKLSSNVSIARVVDVGMMILSPIAAVIFWIFRLAFPLWALIFLGVVGGYLAYEGFNSIRSRKSFFESYVFFYSSLDEKEDNVSTWQKWINSRLPDPEQQQALREALDKTYPPSKFKTFVGLIVIGCGGWLVLTALSAVIQYIIEKGLDRLFQ